MILLTMIFTSLVAGAACQEQLNALPPEVQRATFDLRPLDLVNLRGKKVSVVGSMVASFRAELLREGALISPASALPSTAASQLDVALAYLESDEDKLEILRRMVPTLREGGQARLFGFTDAEIPEIADRVRNLYDGKIALEVKRVRAAWQERGQTRELSGPLIVLYHLPAGFAPDTTSEEYGDSW